MTAAHCLGYGMDDLRSEDRIAGKSEKFIASEKRSDSLWSPNSLQFHA